MLLRLPKPKAGASSLELVVLEPKVGASVPKAVMLDKRRNLSPVQGLE
jgi:hypothetical protein